MNGSLGWRLLGGGEAATRQGFDCRNLSFATRKLWGDARWPFACCMVKVEQPEAQVDWSAAPRRGPEGSDRPPSQRLSAPRTKASQVGVRACSSTMRPGKRRTDVTGSVDLPDETARRLVRRASRPSMLTKTTFNPESALIPRGAAPRSRPRCTCHPVRPAVSQSTARTRPLSHSLECDHHSLGTTADREERAERGRGRS